MKIILSVGIGRLHFCEVNLALKGIGVSRRMICGWLPNQRMAPLVNLAGRVLGRPDLYQRLSRRFMDGQLSRDDFYPLALPELLAGVLGRITALGWPSAVKCQTLTWKFYGWASRRALKDADVLHVRSGAGQGGAIARARAAGMKIVVDQSIAHPAYMDSAIGPEYRRVGAENGLTLSSPFWQLVLKDCAEADLLLVNSAFVKQTFVDEGYPADRIRVEHLGIPDYFYGAKQSWDRISKERVELLYTGGLVLRKGVRCLLESLQILRDRNVPFRLTVAGDASEGQRYFAEELKASDINLIGFVPREQLKELIQQSDLYVFPTLSEGCAQSAMEALGAGLPVITTRGCGLPGEAGEHYASVGVNDASALADKVEALASDRVARERFGQAGAELLVEHYTWQSYGQRLKLIYEQLLGAKA